MRGPTAERAWPTGDALTLEAVRSGTDFQPELGLVLGSGLGDLADGVEDVWSWPYTDLPGFPRTTVAGHAGRLVLGFLEGRRVCVFRGRFHVYEGYAARDVTAGVRLLQGLGGTCLLVTNAAGVVNPRLVPGRPMILADQIDLTWTSSLVGGAAGDIRGIFPQMSEPFDGALRRLLRSAAAGAGVAFEEGVYGGVAGPSYETPAEVELLRRAGADAVGMSTVPEVIAARERGLRVAGIACLTNHAAGRASRRLRHADVLAASAAARPSLERLVRGFLRRLPSVPPGEDTGRP